MSKPKKLVESKKLSGLGGVRDVSFGAAPPERRMSGDYSKSGIAKDSSDSFDDYREKQERWDRTLGKL